MLPTWGYYVNDQPTLTMKNARTYGRWLGARFKNSPNIVWVNGGDRIATGFEDVYRELARGPARRRRRRAPHHLPSLRLALVVAVFPR